MADTTVTFFSNYLKDSRAILSNPDLLPDTPWSWLLEHDFWGTPLNDSGSHGSYRPLCVLTFRLNHWIGGFRPWGYHLVKGLSIVFKNDEDVLDSTDLSERCFQDMYSNICGLFPQTLGR
nr:unnamed protein product [Callosobruchus analis]